MTVELPFKYENNQTKLSKNDHSENSEKSIAGKNILVTEDNALDRRNYFRAFKITKCKR